MQTKTKGYYNVLCYLGGRGISGKCFHWFYFWKTSLEWGAGDGKSYSYQQQSNGAL